MVKFPSKEWMDLYVERLKSNDIYKDSARDWEGDITFVCRADGPLKNDIAMWLDLYHGECRDARYFQNASDAPKSAFRYIGPFGNWVKLIQGQIDPLQGVLTGKFKLEGPMMKIMRYTKAAKELVRTASKIDTEF
ncbi:MAG: SCP2 sterol-binding domain-containing protein [Candidatus Thermoplasmatota archaeon]|nr:SCP2 sterol-binding domain-containing protein [Candidatus Thermoplasmatota archaeon]